MGFKKIDPKLTFAEIALASSMEKNRSLDTLMNMNAVIDWSKIEKLLLKHYIIGKSSEGADAYPSFNVVQGDPFTKVVPHSL